MVGSSRFGFVVKTVLAAAFLCSGYAVPVVANDRLFPDTQKVVYGQKKKHEFGSSWYIRGSAAWSRDKTPALFSNGILAAPSRPENSWNVSIGFGYKINNWFRTDVTLGIRQDKTVNTTSAGTFACPLEVRGVDQLNPDGSTTPIGITALENQCRQTQNASLRRMTVMFNAFIDLGTWSGVTPFVGVGVGGAYGRVRAISRWIDTANNMPYAATLTAPGGYPLTWLPFDKGYQFGVQNKYRNMSKSQLNFAWALMAGFAFDVSPNAKLELSYRYLNMGKWGQATSANVAHDYRIGFRYMID